MTEIDNIRKLYTPPTDTPRDKIMATHNELCYAYHPVCAIQVLLKKIDELEARPETGGQELWEEHNVEGEDEVFAD